MILSALIDAARLGDLEAIAALLSETLDIDHSLTIKAERLANRLEILLEGPVIPPQGRCAQSIYVTIAYLAIPEIDQLQIQAKATAASPVSSWLQQSPLQSLPLPAPPPPELPVQGSPLATPSTVAAASTQPIPSQSVTDRKRGRSLLNLFILVGLLSGGSSALYVQHLTHRAQLNQVPNQTLSSQSISPQSPPAVPTLQANSTFNRQPAAAPTSTPAVVIKAVGDIIPGTDYPRYKMPQDPDYLFRSIQPFLEKDADILFGNFESTITSHPHSAKDLDRGATFAFRTPPAYADVIKSAGFDVMSVANNHSFDFGEQGFADTIAHLEKSGIQTTGRKGEITYTEANGLQIAFIAFSYFDQHNSMHDLATAEALIRQADEQADIIIVSVHAGAEGTDAARTRNQTEYYLGENRGNLVQFSHAVVDYGADLVLGHGPHVVRAVELYQNRLIAYSLGNFLGHKTLSNQAALGISMILSTGLDAEGAFVSGRVIPVALDPNGVPYLDDHFQGVVLVRRLTQMDFPLSALVIDDMGYILPSKFIE